MAAVSVPRLRQSARSVLSVSSSVVDKPPVKPVSRPISLSKRLLFPHLTADADLPPLLASPAAEPVLNAELYDFMALALRAFVNPWWTKITRYDKEFLPAITSVLTIIIRALEARLTATDLSPLVFRDLPTLLTQHLIDYRNAKSKLHTSYASGGAATLPQLFHQLQPHMAVSPDGRIDKVYVRQAVDHILKECMSPEDYEADAERYIVREVILKVLLESAVPRITQPWFIHKLMLDFLGPRKDNVKLAEPPDPSHSPSPVHGPRTPQRHSHTLQGFAIFFLSAVQSFSGVCILLIQAYRQARDTIKKVNESAAKTPHRPSTKSSPSASSDAFSAVAVPLSPTSPSVPGALTITTTPDSPPLPVPHPPPTPPTPTSISSVNPISRSTSSSTVPSTSSASNPLSVPRPPVPPIPNYTQPPLTLLLTLLSPPRPSSSTETAAPGSSSSATALAVAHTLSLPLTFAAPFLARLLPYLLYTHALSAAHLAGAVRAARRALFPEGWPGPPPPDPTPEEQAALREELVQRLLASVPAPLDLLLGPTPAARMRTIDAALDPFSSQACNAHLVLFILDLVLLTVFPELGASESAPACASAGVSVSEMSSKPS
ncbi:hypothetical protein AcV5_004335 [Taiwanofungus camphoratus]|nr:hypothetical protein AcV5_004335 [Antrodia cinnamomea]